MSRQLLNRPWGPPRHPRIVALAAILILSLAACGGEETAPTPAATAAVESEVAEEAPTATAEATATQEPATPTEEPSPTIQPGDSEHELAVNELQRSYLVHTAPGLNRQEPLPVVFAFHGYAMSAEQMKGLTGFNNVADRAGFLVVYPVGVGSSWNVGDVGLGIANDRNIDEAAFVQAILSELGTTVEIDPEHIYAAGFSQGGALVYELACERSDLFAAVASVSGPMDYSPCEPDRPVSVMHVHGLADEGVPFSGGGSIGVPPVQEGLSTWQQLNGCTGSPQIEELSDTITHTVHSSCESGTAVELYTIATLGHDWPSAPPITRIIWDFFATHPKS